MRKPVSHIYTRKINIFCLYLGSSLYAANTRTQHMGKTVMIVISNQLCLNLPIGISLCYNVATCNKLDNDFQTSWIYLRTDLLHQIMTGRPGQAGSCEVRSSELSTICRHDWRRWRSLPETGEHLQIRPWCTMHSLVKQLENNYH